MIEFINCQTGNLMYVHVQEENEKNGHMLYSTPEEFEREFERIRHG